MQIKEQELLSKYTTWRIGGPARIMYQPENQTELIQLLRELHEHEQEFYILGGGSNLLAADQGTELAVINTSSNLVNLKIEDCIIRAEAGVPLPLLAYRAAEAGLSGLEFASGIPGTVGGAIVMNAGAYGGQMADVVEKVICSDRTGELLVLTPEECAFAYRQSRFKQDRNLIIIEVVFHLRQGVTEEIKAVMQERQVERKTKQPLEYPNAGSVFKNPVGHSAGLLIEAAGAKGWRIGDAAVSEKHANFIVNLGQARQEDVVELVKKVKETVKMQFEIELEEEFIYFPVKNQK